MHFLKPTFITLLTTLFTTAKAQNACTGTPTDFGYCSILSFIDRTTTSPSPPTLSDCDYTCRVGIFGDAGDWGLDLTGPVGQRRSVVGFGCGYSIAKPAGQPQNVTFSMTNQDIADCFAGLIQRFGGLHNGRVAGGGEMVCEGKRVRWFVD